MWDWLPQVLTLIFGSGLNVIITEDLVGIVGLFILWVCWREAIRSQIVLAPEINDILASERRNI